MTADKVDFKAESINRDKELRSEMIYSKSVRKYNYHEFIWIYSLDIQMGKKKKNW